MMEFERNRLTVKSEKGNRGQIITAIPVGGEVRTPAFRFDFNPTVERDGVGRHSVSITVDDPNKLGSIQRKYDSIYTFPFDYANNVEFSFGRNLNEIIAYRSISGDKPTSLILTHLGEDFTYDHEDISGKTEENGNEISFSVVSEGLIKTVTIPRRLNAFIDRSGNTSSEAAAELAQLVKFNILER